MAQLDKDRWDTKHKENMMPHTPLEFITTYSKLAMGKKALDIACGMGRHSKYLTQEGFVVDALDISSVAIDNLQNIENINANAVIVFSPPDKDFISKNLFPDNLTLKRTPPSKGSSSFSKAR